MADMKLKSVIKIIVGIIVIGGGISYFMYQAMQSSWSYYYSVDEFAANNDEIANSSFRLAGDVKPGSIKRDAEKMLLTFVLAGKESELPVSYSKTVPDNFTDDIEVVIEGRMDASGTFQADSLMTKCESKYEAKLE
jgi:cytochrome c-type biogenesis protein CcmE